MVHPGQLEGAVKEYRRKFVNSSGDSGIAHYLPPLPGSALPGGRFPSTDEAIANGMYGPKRGPLFGVLPGREPHYSIEKTDLGPLLLPELPTGTELVVPLLDQGITLHLTFPDVTTKNVVATTASDGSRNLPDHNLKLIYDGGIVTLQRLLPIGSNHTVTNVLESLTLMDIPPDLYRELPGFMSMRPKHPDEHVTINLYPVFQTPQYQNGSYVYRTMTAGPQGHELLEFVFSRDNGVLLAVKSREAFIAEFVPMLKKVKPGEASGPLQALTGVSQKKSTHNRDRIDLSSSAIPLAMNLDSWIWYPLINNNYPSITTNACWACVISFDTLKGGYPLMSVEQLVDINGVEYWRECPHPDLLAITRTGNSSRFIDSAQQMVHRVIANHEFHPRAMRQDIHSQVMYRFTFKVGPGQNDLETLRLFVQIYTDFSQDAMPIMTSQHSVVSLVG